MSGDYSRMRFSPRPGYIAPLEQQGRVRLEADANELVESLDRRRRAEAIDTIGHGVIPMTTQSGFEIKIDAQGNCTIGIGRAYVDGILVDCWGDPASTQNFQADLGEVTGSKPLPFNQQPFYYTATPAFPAPPAPGSGQWAIVYLDVWEREVTALEDPGLIDPALEQIDTTTRLQAAWQVKALGGIPNNALCSDTPTKWTTLITPSDAWLTTGTSQAPNSNSPCIIDPVGGYTGFENRLYRVQICQGGNLGGATPVQFVWSRDNASLGAVVTNATKVSNTESQLTVSTVGKDKSFRFQQNDWLEILDDNVEFALRETNQGGQIVQVLKVDAGQLTINVNADVSGWFNAGTSNARIRKWDAGPQPVTTGAAITLEDGVTVTFGTGQAQKFCAGDYWVFYARTATGQVEVLTQAPPRGVLHHYMKLAMVNSGTVTDPCRVFWPPPTGEGCCTVVVNVGDDIQKAIDSLPAAGGCVCLKTGIHNITAPINILGRTNISFHGESIGAVVRNTQGDRALVIGISGNSSPADITIEAITFEVTLPVGQVTTNAIVEISSVAACALRDCILQPAPQQPMPAGFGIRVNNAHQLEIRGNQIDGVWGGITATQPQDLVIEENMLAGPAAQGSAGVSGGGIGIDLTNPAGVVLVSGNEIADFSQGVLAVNTSGFRLKMRPVRLRVGNNMISRQALASTQPGNLFQPSGPLGKLLEQKAWGVVTDVPGAVVSENTIQIDDPGHGGVLVFASEIEVRDNAINSSVASPQNFDWASLPLAIAAYKPLGVPPETGPIVEHCRITGNSLAGPQRGIAVLAENIATYQPDAIICPAVVGNRISNGVVPEQIDLTFPGGAPPTLFQGGLTALQSAFGILMINVDRATVVRNVVSQCTVGIAGGPFEINSDANATASATLEGNAVDLCTIGILLYAMANSAVNNGTLRENGLPVALYKTKGVTVAGNQSQSGKSVAHCLDYQGADTKFKENTIADGATGFLAVLTNSVCFDRNQVNGTNGTGILAFLCEGEILVEGNNTLYCGASGTVPIEANLVGTLGNWQFGQTVSSAIAIVHCPGLITIDSCEVRNSTLAAGLRCVDVFVLGVTDVRIHNCRIIRADYLSQYCRALLVLYDQPAANTNQSPATAFVGSNYINFDHVSQLPNADFVSVEVSLPISSGYPTSGNVTSDLIMVGNEVVHNCNLYKPAVELNADTLAITGNRIRRIDGSPNPSLQVVYGAGLSLVGNLVTNGENVSGWGALKPNPVADFNVTA